MRGARGGSLRLGGRRADSELRCDGLESEKQEVLESDTKARKLERKHSLLDRLFGRRKTEEEASEVKKEIRVFSGQFPPPGVILPKVRPGSICQTDSFLGLSPLPPLPASLPTVLLPPGQVPPFHTEDIILRSGPMFKL